MLCLCACLLACSTRETPSITIATNPWPGYEFLYLAEQKGFFQDLGVNVKIAQLGALSDVQRSYINGDVDGFASTVVEALEVQTHSQRPLKIVLVSDYSNGGDVIIAPTTISSLKELKGKRIGSEAKSLGPYMLRLALSEHKLSIDDIEMVSVGQLNGAAALKEGRIDAFVTYPPASIALLRDPAFHTVFSSAEVPDQILDVVSLSDAVIQSTPGLVSTLYHAWGRALHFYKTNPEEAVRIMAARERISADEFVQALEGVVINDVNRNRLIFNERDTLVKTVFDTCTILEGLEAHGFNCDQSADIVYKH